MKLPRSALLLTSGIVALVAATLGFQTWAVLQGRQRALSQAALRAANRAQATANQVEAVFKAVDLVLMDMSEHLDPRELESSPGPGAEGRRRQMRDLMRLHVAMVPLIWRIQAVSADGRCVFSSLGPSDVPALAGRYDIQLRESTRMDRLWISEPYRDPGSGRWGIDLTRRLAARDGHCAGLLQATVDAGALSTIMEAVDQRHWILALYHDNRQMAARSPMLPAASAPVPQGLRQPVDDSGPAVAYQGPGFGEARRCLWAAQHLDGIPMFAVAGYSSDLALSQWRQDLRTNLAAAGLLVAGSIGILALLRRYLGAAQALRSREAYFRTLFDASPEAIAVVDACFTVDANRRYRELFRFPGAESAPPWELAPVQQPDGSDSRSRGNRLADPGDEQPSSFQWLCQRADGSCFEAEIRVTRSQHAGRALRIAVVRDLTEIRALEAKLHQAQKLDALGQLAGGVAHDFNNMLAAIHASAEVLAERCADDGLRRTSSLITAAAERASQLTRQLLTFARQGKILSTPTDFHQILRDAGALLERTLDRRIHLDLQLGAERALVVGDPSQLESAIINLAVNARDAMPDGGDLVFTTEQVVLDAAGCRIGPTQLAPGDYLHLEVQDTGPGIAPEHLLRIFDPFFTTKAPGQGTGLGLASVFGTMASHHGAVTAENRAGGGAAFHLYLPLAAGARAIQAAAPAPVPGSGTVLVIDDEELVRATTALQLQSLGYQALLEADPAAGIETFRANHAALSAVLLDLVMPKASGLEVAAVLRELDPAVPVVIASGFPRSAKIDELLAGGLAGYLQKPYSRRDLGELLDRFRVAERCP
jgi:PAS domain S-box-containing protein